jgi:hypothetical protein
MRTGKPHKSHWQAGMLTVWLLAVLQAQTGRHLVTADVGLQIRPRLAWYNNDDKKARNVFQTAIYEMF